LTQENEAAEAELAELKLESEKQVAVVQASLEEMTRLRARLDSASKALLESQNEWVNMSTELIKKMDEANSLAVQVTSYQTMAAQLAKDYQNAMEVLRIHGLPADPALFTQRPPAGIQGVVTEVRPLGNVEVSVGSDSGLVKGHQLDVVRERDGRSVYVGKIEITSTAADRASAKVMPAFRGGVVQLGDVVTYIDVDTVVAH
jgi:hypothetical protein